MTEDDNHASEREFSINRRDVMKAAGAATVLTGFSGVGAATGDSDDCSCESGTTQCFPEKDTNCSYCKITLNTGESCTIPGTKIKITQESSRCISYSDPDNAVSDIALKSGDKCPCTYLSEVGLKDGQLCTTKSDGTECSGDISHITVEYNCDDKPPEPPEECDYENDAIDSVNFGCETVDATLTGVEKDCPVKLVLSFWQDDCAPKTVDNITTNNPDPIDVPDCCTPRKLSLQDPSGKELDSRVTDFAPGKCINENLDRGDFDIEWCCNKVTVTVTKKEDLECPVKATLNAKTVVDGADCETKPMVLSPENTKVVFELDECGCVPKSVKVNGFTFYAPDLDCFCDDFTEVCKIEEDKLQDACTNGHVTVDCGKHGKITIEDAKCEDDELICFNFTSTFDVFKVFVKGGGGRDTGNEYIWPCGTTDSDDPKPSKINFETEGQTYNGKLCSNIHPKNGRQTAVSHVTFFVCAEELDTC